MTDLPASTAPAAAGYLLVQGRCPACRGSSLFLGSGGYLTCSRLDCPNPSAADDVLHRTAPAGELREHLAAAVDKAIDYNNLDNLTDFSERLVAAVLTAVEDFLDIGDAEAWCKICRRVWDSKRHRCEGDAERRLSEVLTTLDDVLRHFVHKGHPGEPCLSSGWVSEKTVARWRAVAYPPQPAAHDTGPTVREAAANDRHRPLEREGE
jgi:hypothetical protein